MSRTTIEIPMNTNNIDEVLQIVATKMSAAGFQQKNVDNETAWIKGDGMIMKMQCLGTIFTGKSVIIQGWMKDAITGESNLDGLVAILPKRKMKKIINEIASIITLRNL